MAVAVDRQQRCLGCIHVQPFRKQDVDLMHMLLEGGKAGRIVCNVIGRAQAFAGVQGDFRGLALGLPPRWPLVLGAMQNQRTIRQSLVVVLGRGQQQLRQVLVAQHVEDETSQNQRGNHGRNVQNAPQPLPSLALGIEEYLFIWHRQGWSRLHMGENRGNGLRYTVRIVWKLPPRVN